MTPTLFHAVARRADALTPDADLLTRYIRAREGSGEPTPNSPNGEAAFEELVRRHGPLVWAVCRQMLPVHADAEDAFQAVFLTLTRCAATIRDGRGVSAWLHGVAVRVATRARRTFARRRARERAAALGEADRPVSDASWDALAAAVHEEVQHLPEAERTAFVLCDLQGVSQPDAAARLGWALGSVSGRLCKARQRLLNRLIARGIAPAAAVGIGMTAGSASAATPRGLPPALFDAVKTFPTSPAAASAVAATLARGLTEGVTMRAKLMAATAVLVAAVGLTGTAVVLSKADAQPPGSGRPPGAPAGGSEPSQAGPGMPPAGAPPMGPFGGGGRAGPGATGGGGMPGAPVAPATWEYKFVDSPGNRKQFEETIVQHGKDGWEYCSSERWLEGNKAEWVLVFKKRKGGEFGGATGGGSGPGAPGGTGGANPGTRVGGGENEFKVFPLKHTDATVVVEALQKALGNKGQRLVAENGSNSVVVVSASAAVLKDIAKLIEVLDGPRVARPGDGAATDALVFPLKNIKGADAANTLRDVLAGSGLKFQESADGTAFRVSGDPATLQKFRGTIEKLIVDAEAQNATAPKPAAGLNVFTLKNARAEEMVTVLKKLYPNADMTADPRTNTVIARTDERTLEEMRMLITRLESLETPKGK